MRAVALVFVLLAPGKAVAQSDARERLGRRHFLIAERHFERERFEEAFREYETAYAIAPLPGLLFNMGQCQRLLGNRERALNFYRRFLEEVPDAPNRDVVEGFIRELDPGVSEAAGPPPPPASEPAAERESVQALEEEPDPPRAAHGISVLTASVLGVGLGLVAVSGAFALRAANAEEDLSDAERLDCSAAISDCLQIQDRGDQAATLRTVLFWSGIGAIAAAGLLLWWDLTPESDVSVAIGPGSVAGRMRW